MKTMILSFSVPMEYGQLIKARKRAEGMTGSEYMRKCVREEAERHASQNSRMFRGVNLRTLISAVR